MVYTFHSLQDYPTVIGPSARSCTAYALLIWAWLGKVPPLPLNTVTAALKRSHHVQSVPVTSCPDYRLCAIGLADLRGTQKAKKP